MANVALILCKFFETMKMSTCIQGNGIVRMYQKLFLIYFSIHFLMRIQKEISN